MEPQGNLSHSCSATHQSLQTMQVPRWRDALSCFSRAVDEDPLDSRGYAHRARACLALGDLRQARAPTLTDFTPPRAPATRAAPRPA
jgi:Flp pilus assembly protein TadD